MKYLLSFGVIALMIAATSCKDQTKDETKAAEGAEITSAEETPPTKMIDCFSSYQIYPETAYLWEQSWINFYRQYEKYQDTLPLKIRFNEAILTRMYNQLKDSDTTKIKGVLLYYVMTTNDQYFPSLVMVNTLNCAPVWDAESFEMVSPTSVNSSIDLAQFNTYKQFWEDWMNDNNHIYTNVSGYNYAWNELWSIVDSGNPESGMFVTYGIRTLEPGDNHDFGIKDSSMTGSVVYCNILHKMIPSYIDTYSGVSDGEMELLDFALPCPIYCD